MCCRMLMYHVRKRSIMLDKVGEKTSSTLAYSRPKPNKPNLYGSSIPFPVLCRALNMAQEKTLPSSNLCHHILHFNLRAKQRQIPAVYRLTVPTFCPANPVVETQPTEIIRYGSGVCRIIAASLCTRERAPLTEGIHMLGAGVLAGRRKQFCV